MPEIKQAVGAEMTRLTLHQSEILEFVTKCYYRENMSSHGSFFELGLYNVTIIDLAMNILYTKHRSVHTP